MVEDEASPAPTRAGGNPSCAARRGDR